MTNSSSPFFDATAMPDRDWWQVLWPDPEHVLRQLGVTGGMTVVDLCCGDGYFTAPLSKLVDGRVYAIDIDPVMLGRTRAEVLHLGAPDCALVEADARDVDRVIPAMVDYVLIANTFHGVPDRMALTVSVSHVLKAGGVFAIINWHPAPRETTLVLGKPRGPPTGLRMSPAETRRAVEPAGFRLDRIVELPPYHYAAIFIKT